MRDLVSLILLCLLAGPLFAQGEPCDFFDYDGQTGYSQDDFYYTLSNWNQTGQAPDIPDFDSDGRVTILDMVRQSNCIQDLSHGLLGKYYGFEDGTPDQEITFPDFSTLPATHKPVVMRATERFEFLEGWNDFMDSGMRRQFGAVYDGYLFVPETARYTIHAFARGGVRVILDGQQLFEVDGWPHEDQATLDLDYGLYPIRLEYYVADEAGRILLDWSSNGSIIPSTPEVIDTQYLYHQSEAVPEYTATEIEGHFNWPSGSWTNKGGLTFQVYFTGPNSDMTLRINGVEYPMLNGYFDRRLILDPGINHLDFEITDGDGRVKVFNHKIYADREQLTRDGLAANIYAADWLQSPFPSPETLVPLGSGRHSGTQLVRLQNGRTRVANRELNGGAIVQLQGVIEIPQTGWYTFRSRETGGVYINGEFVCGIDGLYRGQWQPEGDVFLDKGNHHYRFETSDPWDGPDATVYWRFNDGAETEIPNTAFRHADNHRVQVPGFVNNATRTRTVRGQIAEYVFAPDANLVDTSGNGFDLWPDLRAIPVSTGGVAFETGGSLTTVDGGTKIVGELVKENAFSLEVDFMTFEDYGNGRTRTLISLDSVHWDNLTRIFIQGDDVRFRIWDENGDQYTLTAENVVVPGERLNLIGTYNGSSMSLYVNGRRYNQGLAISIAGWPNVARFTVSQHLNRRANPNNNDNQARGIFFVAACYNRALAPGEVDINRQINRVINRTPDDMPAPTPVTFPLAGASGADVEEAMHVLNRVTFGPSPSLINEVLTAGVDNWLGDQLDPDAINDDQLEAYLARNRFRPEHWIEDFRAQALTRMTLSRRQVLEKMTQFWENHFNTQIEKTDYLERELFENELFRANALGTFDKIIEVSASHYPMTVYLDSSLNIVGAQNENYAREILELHTMGVNNGYTEADIAEAARIFTGWTVRNGRFYFDPGRHDYGEKNLLGITIPAGGGISDGIALIEHLVTRSETADFITWKLCQFFIDDNPPADVHAAASATFQATSGDITATLQTIFAHARFRTDPTMRANKVKDPMEYMLGIARMLETDPSAHAVNYYMKRMGMEMFNYADPTGFAEEGVAWVDTNSMLERWNRANSIITNRGSQSTLGVNLPHFLRKYAGGETPTALLSFFENLIAPGRLDPGVEPIMSSWMTNDNPGGFTFDEDTIDTRIRQTLALYMRLAECSNQ